MRFAELATLVVVLLRAFGEVTEETSTHLQEDCAGVGNIACATRLFHLQAARRDVKYNPLMDLLTTCGFLAALQGVRALRKGCLWWVAPPCSTWIYLARGSTGRTFTRPRGSKRYRNVRRANRLIRRMIYLCEYCHKKGLHYCIENPMSSLLWTYRPMEAMLKRHGCRAISVPLGAYGALSEKRVTLYTTAPYLLGLGKPIDPCQRERLARLKSTLNLKLVRHYRDKRGQKKIKGGPHLTQSGMYPINLGLKVGSLLSTYVQEHKPEVSPDASLKFDNIGDDSFDQPPETFQ